MQAQAYHVTPGFRWGCRDLDTERPARRRQCDCFGGGGVQVAEQLIFMRKLGKNDADEFLHSTRWSYSIFGCDEY